MSIVLNISKYQGKKMLQESFSKLKVSKEAKDIHGFKLFQAKALF